MRGATVLSKNSLPTAQNINRSDPHQTAVIVRLMLRSTACAARGWPQVSLVPSKHSLAGGALRPLLEVDRADPVSDATCNQAGRWEANHRDGYVRPPQRHRSPRAFDRTAALPSPPGATES